MRDILQELMREAQQLTPDELLSLASHLEERARQADPGVVVRSRRRKIAECRERVMELAAKYGAFNVRVFDFSVDGGGVSDTEVNFLVELEPGRSLLDQGGLLVELRELLGFELYVFTEEGLKDRYRQQILERAVELCSA